MKNVFSATILETKEFLSELIKIKRTMQSTKSIKDDNVTFFFKQNVFFLGSQATLRKSFFTININFMKQYILNEFVITIKPFLELKLIFWHNLKIQGYPQSMRFPRKLNIFISNCWTIKLFPIFPNTCYVIIMLQTIKIVRQRIKFL